MPNLEGIGLQNFRTFSTNQTLEFAPITLITGTNNAGKSSVFKALQFLIHNFKNGIHSETLDFKTMQHELGDLERIYNRSVMEAFKKADLPASQHMYAKLMDFQKKNEEGSCQMPVFAEPEDLVFTFPIKLGNSREIDATLEIRYGLERFISKHDGKGTPSISHGIKHVAIVKDGAYLQLSNIIGRHENPEDGVYWQMQTSIDLKKILQLITETPLSVSKYKDEPSEESEEDSRINLFSRIEKHPRILFDIPFFKLDKDGYEDFTSKFIQGKSLFSDYSALAPAERSRLQSIENDVIAELFQGKDNSQTAVLECFKHSFSGGLNGMEFNIALAEEEFKRADQEQKNSGKKILREQFKKLSLPSTQNSLLFTNLLRAIEHDFFGVVEKKIRSLSKVYFLPTARGRNRAWFIDEQNSEDIQLARDFSLIYPEEDSPIQNFINFWIGQGAVNKIDEQGDKKLKLKGFNIGQGLSVYRDETIGLTRIFLVNFDGTKTPLVDLGYGVSQLLPIIMKIATIAHEQQMSHDYHFNNEEGLYEKRAIFYRPSTLLIEEPEANLHPSLQSKMAELLIDAASRFNIQFLIETHSEYLIYKFQEYIGEKIVSPKDVKIYYFNHPNDIRTGVKSKHINNVEIASDGSIDYEEYFGKGFFDEQTNMRMSLLNIQRNRFIEDFEANRDELKASLEQIKNYDLKIVQLQDELSTTNLGKNAIEAQLETIKTEKEEREATLNAQVAQQLAAIDEYTAKLNYAAYKTEIQAIIDPAKIDSSKTLEYLSTGKYLLRNLHTAADFAPVIIQYGRAVEFEMIKWVSDFKNTLTTTEIIQLCSDGQYKDGIRQLFADLGLPLVNNDRTREIAPAQKLYLLHLKNCLESDTPNWKFGGLAQIFELLHYVSPTKNTFHNYHSVPLLRRFSDYLRNTFRDYDRAEALFDTFRQVVDLRNCAGHTYSDSVCTSDIISKTTAEHYVAQVELIFDCL